ncbi:fibronectin type 3 domain-containing protein [Streptacidiphilus sp. MAP12-16]|uniref:fibronectin type III domain-containing protein n=1 Tax=Streptacidiphilus sp. MAP12-16 TaxID=3156300 RepID=UPI0035115B89
MRWMTAPSGVGLRRLLGSTLAVALVALAASLGLAGPSSATTPAAKAAASASWTGTFDGFPSTAWHQSWGITPDSQQCQGATSTAPCNWGYSNLQAVSDPTAPGGGQALKVTYPAPSGPPSCGCGLGGGQFYQNLNLNGQQALAQSPTVDLKYWYNFPVGFDFGGKTAGKMPGLYGGVPGCESGGQHCNGGWSTRYMWRGGSTSAPNGELYFYTAAGSGFGADLCLGNWHFPADGKWHSIEQLVNTGSGQITIWSDGGSTPVCQTTQTLGGTPVSGTFFSTFHGGHDTSWSPRHTTTDEFADFTLSTAQQSGGGTSPATPTGLAVSGSTSSSVTLNWTEPTGSDPAASYRVYEGSAVVATSTTTGATLSGLAAGSTHSYTVTAVDAAGVESGHSAAVTATLPGGGGGAPAAPIGLTVTNTTGTTVDLSWTEPTSSDPAASYRVYEGGTVVATNTVIGATISGLAPGSTHTYTVVAVDAAGVESPHSAAVTVVVPGGGGGGLTASVGKIKDWGSGYTDEVTVTNNSPSTATGWNVQLDLDPSMNIESVASAALTSSGRHETFASTSSNGSIAPGAHVTFQFSGDYTTGYVAPTNVTVNGQSTGGSPAVPTGLTVGSVTSSSVPLSWSEPSGTDPAASYRVYEGSTVVATSTSTSATVGGLAAGSTHTYAVSAVDAAGVESARSAPVSATTSAGGPTAPPVPTALAVTGTTNSAVALGWSEASSADPAVSYRVYEGSTVVATSTTTSATVGGLAAGSTHTYAVSAVDAAGVESARSAPVSATTSGSGGGGTFTQAEIDSAVAAPGIAYAVPTSAVPRPGTNPVNIGAAKVLYYLALVDRQAPGTKATDGTTVDSALLAQVRSLIAGGHEPDADGGLEGWAHAPVAQALLLLKNGPTWSELSAAEQNKVSLLEEAMGFAGNYTYNDASSFSSGICGFGNFSKTNNPNYRDGYVDVEAAAIQYFGAAAWDGMLAGFNDATMASQLDAAGLTNAGGCYTTVGSAANAPIQRPFVWEGHHTTDLMGIWNQLAADTFDKTVTSVNGPAHIADGSTSPVQGQLGMGHEFASTDSAGLRSSALYVFEGWMNVTGNRVAMSALGNFSCSTASSAARYSVGSQDLIYKLHHGYYSYGLNQNGVLTDDHGDPATDGPDVKGYLYDLDAYHALIGTQSC